MFECVDALSVLRVFYEEFFELIPLCLKSPLDLFEPLEQLVSVCKPPVIILLCELVPQLGHLNYICE